MDSRLAAWSAGAVGGVAVVAAGWLTWRYGPEWLGHTLVGLLVVVLIAAAFVLRAGRRWMRSQRRAFLLGLGTPAVIALLLVAVAFWLLSGLSES